MTEWKWMGNATTGYPKMYDSFETVRKDEAEEKLAEKDKEIERLNHEIERLKGPSQAERILATDRSNVIP